MFNLTRVLELTLYGGKDPHSGEQIGLATPALDQMASLPSWRRPMTKQMALLCGPDGAWLQHRGRHSRRGAALALPVALDCRLHRARAGCHRRRRALQLLGRAGRADRQRGRQPGGHPAGSIRRALAERDEAARCAAQRLCRQRGAAPAADQPCAQVWQRRRPCRPASPPPGATATASWSSSTRPSAGVSTSQASTPSRRTSPWAPTSAPRPMAATPASPLADGGLSPTAGRDRRGATAVLHSVSKLDLQAGLQRHTAQHEVPALLL